MNEAAYPATPGFKREGTSEQAALEIAPLALTLKAHALIALKQKGPMTADECAAHLCRSILAVRPRCTELEADGLIEDSGERRTNGSGKSAIVWRAK